MVDVRKPIFQAHLLVPPTGFFNTPEEAWNEFRTKYVEVELTPRYGTKVKDFRACEPPRQYGYIWGIPINWCHDEDFYANDEYGYSVVSEVATEIACPNGYTLTNGTPLSGSGWGSDPYIWEYRCEKSAVVSDPRVCTQCGNPPINADDGSNVRAEPDYVSPGGTLTFTRTYDSKRGGFTPNFAGDFLPPAAGGTASCSLMSASNEHWTPTTKFFCVERLNSSSASASYTSPEGYRYDFSWNGSSGTPLLPYNKDRLATSASGGWTLTRPGELRMLSFDASGRLRAVDFSDGRRAQLDYSTGAIAGVAPAAGFLTSISDSFGRALSLQYTDGGLLARLIDPDGLSISYDHESLLQAQANPLARAMKPLRVTYQDGNSTSYLWDESAFLSGSTARVSLLTGIIDANGDRSVTYSYTNGNATSVRLAGDPGAYLVVDGRSSSVGPVTVTDPLGTGRTWQFALAAGLPRVISQSQPSVNGSAAASTAFSYDASGNIASKTDFNGTKTCRVYDLSRNLETARIDGLSASDACPADIGAFTIAAEASQRKTTTQWHPVWTLTIKQAEPKKTTISVYNGQPDPTASNATVSCAPATALLPDGSPIAVLCKKVEQATTDATGSLGFSATVTGTPRTWTYTYNQYGQVLTARDPLNKLTAYAYYSDTTDQHTMGDLQSVTDTAGRITQYTRYDKSGRLMQSIDANGTVTDTTYTPRGWVKTVTVASPGAAAQASLYDYDGVGQLKKATLPDGSALEYTYDAAHRLTGIKDTAGNSVTYTLDNMGNRKGENLKDPSDTLVRSITRVYDALNRVQSAQGTAQ